MLVVQVVEILWSKETRGAPLSSIRAKLPRAFLIDAPIAPYVFQHIRMEEWEEFNPCVVETRTKTAVPRIEGGLAMQSGEADSFHLGLIGNPSGGKPNRYPVNRALTLSYGESARLIVNGRHTSYSGQWYSEYVYNVMSGSELVPNRFLSRKPDHEFSLAAHLF